VAFVLYRDLADDRVRVLAGRSRGGPVLYDLEDR
jgi:hypothetical protein